MFYGYLMIELIPYEIIQYEIYIPQYKIIYVSHRIMSTSSLPEQLIEILNPI